MRIIIIIDILAQQVFKPNSFRFILIENQPRPPVSAASCRPAQFFLRKSSCFISWKVLKLISCQMLCYTCLEGNLLSRARSDSDISTTFWSFMSFFLLTFDLVMICSYSLAKDIIPNVALMIYIEAVVLQEAPGFGEIKTFPLKASESKMMTSQCTGIPLKPK